MSSFVMPILFALCCLLVPIGGLLVAAAAQVTGSSSDKPFFAGCALALLGTFGVVALLAAGAWQVVSRLIGG